MGEDSLAHMIKRRRESLGFSQARLAELVGRSASTIRNWERGNSTPADPSDAVALAAVLGLEERQVVEAAGFRMADVESRPTVEEAYASLAPERGAAPSPGDTREEVTESQEPEEEDSARDEPERPNAPERPNVPEPPGGREEPAAPVPPEAPAGAVTEQEPEEIRSGSGRRHDESAPLPVSGDAPEHPEEDPSPRDRHPWERRRPPRVREDAPVTRPVPPASRVGTDPVTEPERAEARDVSRAAPPTVLELAQEEPSYLEDPEERQRYRFRAVATAVVVIFLLIVLLWSFDRATDALGSMWNDFTGMLEI